LKIFPTPHYLPVKGLASGIHSSSRSIGSIVLKLFKIQYLLEFVVRESGMNTVLVIDGLDIVKTWLPLGEIVV
jgi:hypothetical protein